MRRMVGDYDDFNKRKICTAREDVYKRQEHIDDIIDDLKHGFEAVK